VKPEPGESGATRARELLRGTAREILARIVPDDPLRLRAAAGRRIVERALLCDVERVCLRAQVLCALAGWDGTGDFERWRAERVDEALAAVLAEDRSALEQERVEPLTPFAAPLALDARALASACARFNALALEERRAFHALVLDGAGPFAAGVARERGAALADLARRARAALQLFRRVVPALAGPRPAGAGS